MRDRSREMLLALARSKKNFTEAELREFLSDVNATSWPDVVEVFSPPPKLAKRAKSSSPASPESAFLTKLDKRRRKYDLPAADAIKQLTERLGDTGLKAASRKSFSGIVKALRERDSEAPVERAFEAILQSHAQTYSLKYDLS